MKINDIEKSHKAIQRYIRKTPLIRFYALELFLKTKAKIYLKCENLQITHSFKIRGAMSALLSLTNEQKKKGVVTRSSGNFAQALSYGCHHLQIPVTIIMPENVPRVKKEKTERYNPKILFGKTRQEEEELVEKIAHQEKKIPFSPYNSLNVMLGQATLALEILEDVEIKYFYCPVGGGGLMSGNAWILKKKKPQIETVAIEPLQANDFQLSLKAKKRTALSHPQSIADGLLAPIVGDLNWPYLQKYVDRVEVVSDNAIKMAMRFLYEKAGLIVEPSGAVTVAALMESKQLLGDTVCVLSGGNVVMDQFYKWIQ